MVTTEAKSSTTTQSLQDKAEDTNAPFFEKDGVNSVLTNDTKGSHFFDNRPAGKRHQPFFSSRPFIQTKLMIGQPGDKYEKEADSMADQVVQRLAENKDSNEQPLLKNSTGLQRKPIFESESEPNIQAKTINGKTLNPTMIHPKCAECEEEEKLQKKEKSEKDNQLLMMPIFESAPSPPDEDTLQRTCIDRAAKEEKLQTKPQDTDAPVASPSLESRLQSSEGSGRSLPEDTRSKMEGVFGSDLSGVRVHTDTSAVQMNKDLGAQAFTHGSDVYFNTGKYDTSSDRGQHLLAHELSHTIQQKGRAELKAIQKQPNTVKTTPTNPTNPIALNNSINTFTGNVDQRSFQNPDQYLPFDTSFNVWEKYLLEAENSLRSMGDRKVSHRMQSPVIGQSGKNLENNVSFLTDSEGKGAGGSINTKTELKASYDFKEYEWIPYNEVKVKIPSTFGKKAHPVNVTYQQTIQYSDSKGREVTIQIFGSIHYTPQRWEDMIRFRVGKIPPSELLFMKGDFGSYHWRLQGKGPMQTYAFGYAGGGGQQQPNLADVSREQPPQMLRNKPLPIPGFVAPYTLPGDQIKKISEYLDAADKIETDHRKWLESLPKAPGGGTRDSGQSKPGGSSSEWKMPTWLAGILTGIGIIVGVVAVVFLAAEIIVAAAAWAGISLTIAAVVKAIAVVGLTLSFLRAMYTRIKEAIQHGGTSPARLIGSILLDTFGVSLLIEAITDESILTGKPLNRSDFERWTAGTVGVITTILSFLGLRNWVKGKTTTPKSPTSSPPVLAGASGRTYNTKQMQSQYVGEETGALWGGSKVKYLSEAERAQLEVFVQNGNLVNKAGRPIDTSSASSVFQGGGGKAIYVMDPNGRIFISSYQAVGKFHHSSFLGGKPVSAAGEIKVVNGKVVEITARSGHYKPTMDQVRQIVTELASRGLDTRNISVILGY